MSEGQEDSDKPLSGVKRVILVLSGKGGVGKSTVTVQLADAFLGMGLKVGILDIDLCGPSIPKMLNLEKHEVHQCDMGWVPVLARSRADRSLAVMSIGFLLQNKDDAVVWRGPKKNAMIKQFMTDVAWQDLDVLLVDTPPGTSDEHITVMENLRPLLSTTQHVEAMSGAVLVTTPQAVAVGDVRREITFCKKANLKILGIVENMSVFVCPHCKECTNIFSSGGGQSLSEHAGVAFLGSVPIDPRLAEAAENGDSFLHKCAESVAAKTFQEMAQKLCQKPL